MDRTVHMLGQSRVNPSEYFKPTAHPVSKSPAIKVSARPCSLRQSLDDVYPDTVGVAHDKVPNAPGLVA